MWVWDLPKCVWLLFFLQMHAFPLSTLLQQETGTWGHPWIYSSEPFSEVDEGDSFHAFFNEEEGSKQTDHCVVGVETSDSLHSRGQWDLME